MMLTQSISGEGEEKLRATETILRNLRVLATDQLTESIKTEDGKTVVKSVRTVTFEVTPRIAEKISVAQTLGTLSLALRSIADNTAELERAVATGDVKVPAGANPAQERQMLLAAANRPLDSNTTFSTGGDVSRFQHRTVPARTDAPAGAGGSPGAAPGAPAFAGPVVRIADRKSTRLNSSHVAISY